MINDDPSKVQVPLNFLKIKSFKLQKIVNIQKKEQLR